MADMQEGARECVMFLKTSAGSWHTDKSTQAPLANAHHVVDLAWLGQGRSWSHPAWMGQGKLITVGYPAFHGKGDECPISSSESEGKWGT